MLRLMLAETYGGKVDDEDDFATLQRIVDNFMTPAAFEADHNILRGLVSLGDGTPVGAEEESLTLPDGTGWPDFLAWVKQLPEREPPTYLGLPGNAEKMLLVAQARKMVADLKLIVGILDE
jgi:dynein heavy chain 1